MTVLGIEQAGRVFGSGPARVVALDNVSLQVSAGAGATRIQPGSALRYQ